MVKHDRKRHVIHTVGNDGIDKWPAIIAVLVIVSIIAGTYLVTRFFEKLHYDNLLQQAYNTTSVMQAKQGEQERDMLYLIQNTKSSINCYQLRSSFANGLCAVHNMNY